MKGVDAEAEDQAQQHSMLCMNSITCLACIRELSPSEPALHSMLGVSGIAVLCCFLATVALLGSAFTETVLSSQQTI